MSTEIFVWIGSFQGRINPSGPHTNTRWGLYPPLPLEIGPLNPAKGSGECCKLPQQGLEWSPSWNRFGCILALNPTYGGDVFNYFAEKQLPIYRPSPAD